MTKELSYQILKECSEAFKSVRKSVWEAARLLHQIHTERLAEDSFGSYGAYVESECGISQSFASKLVKSYQFYVVEGGLSQRKLEYVDSEKAYMALRLEGSPAQKLMKAATLSRRDLKEEQNEEQPHEHEPITLCRICHIKL